MDALFDKQNWIDLYREEMFWRTAATLVIGLISLTILLYSDTLRQLNAERSERAKWVHWNHSR